MLVHRILPRRLAAFGVSSRSLARLAALSCLAALASPTPARAFCRTTTCAEKIPAQSCTRDVNGCWAAGIPLAWSQQCVSFSVSGLGSPRLGLDYDAAESLAVSAFSLWVNAACPDGFPTIAVTSRGPLMCERREYNPRGPNANAVLFRDDAWTYDPSAIALTTVSFKPSTGEILNADMEINSFGYEQLGAGELQFVIAHEAGHFLGLDHSPEPSALMFFQYSTDALKMPMLSADDLAGLCAIYPPTRDVPACNFEPAQGFASDCGGDVTAACAVAPDDPRTGRRTGAGTGAGILSLATLLLAGAVARARSRGTSFRSEGGSLRRPG